MLFQNAKSGHCYNVHYLRPGDLSGFVRLYINILNLCRFCFGENLNIDNNRFVTDENLLILLNRLTPILNGRDSRNL